MHGSMHVSGTYSWKNQGGRRGVLVFEGGVIAPPCRGVGSTLPPPCELARSRPAERPRIVPSGVSKAQFPVLFARDVERDLVRFENRRDLRRFFQGGIWGGQKTRRHLSLVKNGGRALGGLDF